MKTTASSRASRHAVVLLATAVLGPFGLLGSGALGCSSSSTSATGAAACTALLSCCAAMSLATSGACLTIANTQVEESCATTLVTYSGAGLCGAVGVDGGHPGTDAGLSCTLTGTCPPHDDSGTRDATKESSDCQSSGSCSDASPPDAGDDEAGGDDAADASADAADVCGTAPVLHPETANAGPYCPFTAAGSVHCPAQECCEAPSTSTDGSTCEALGSACPIAGSIRWECDGPVDCQGSSAGAVCCAAGTVANDPICGFDRGSGFTGSHCATSCASGELSICSESTDPCASGTCTPFKVAGIVIGTCQ